MFNIDKSVNNLLRSADPDSLLISCMALFWRYCSFSMKREPQFPQTTLQATLFLDKAGKMIARSED